LKLRELLKHAGELLNHAETPVAMIKDDRPRDFIKPQIDILPETPVELFKAERPPDLKLETRELSVNLGNYVATPPPVVKQSWRIGELLPRQKNPLDEVFRKNSSTTSSPAIEYASLTPRLIEYGSSSATSPPGGGW